jgi:DNA recombination protein RmuC
MLIALLILEVVTLLAVVFLLLRRQGPDERLGQVSDQLTRLDARNAALDDHIHTAFAQMRADIATEAQRTREASAADFAALRVEITGSIATLGRTLQTGLDGFRGDNKTSDDQLRSAVQSQMEGITRRIASFTAETNLQHTNLRESLNAKLNELMASNTGLQNQLRTAVEERLGKLNEDNSKELEKMRQTVDESSMPPCRRGSRRASGR